MRLSILVPVALVAAASPALAAPFGKQWTPQGLRNMCTYGIPWIQLNGDLASRPPFAKTTLWSEQGSSMTLTVELERPAPGASPIKQSAILISNISSPTVKPATMAVLIDGRKIEVQAGPRGDIIPVDASAWNAALLSGQSLKVEFYDAQHTTVATRELKLDRLREVVAILDAAKWHC